MKYPEYLKNMPTFKNSIGNVIAPDDSSFDLIISEWADLIKRQYKKGLISLFITGTGVSVNAGVPTISDIIKKLKELYELENIDNRHVNDLFKTFEDFNKRGKKERSIVARLLNTFQEDKEIRNVWKALNKWLLIEIVKNAHPTKFHKKLSDIYDKFGAICLTLNFDGLLIRELLENFSHNDTVNAFSLPTKEECESYFLRSNSQDEGEIKKEFLEIQIRGDILYITCDSKEYCPQKGIKHSLWAYLASYKTNKKGLDIDPDVLLKCPSCGQQGISLLSFPGSYEKEKDMQDMLDIIWKYLAFKVGTVTVVGMSGEWDPLIVAFLGDLLSERGIPMLVVDKDPEIIKSPKQMGEKDYTYIIRELVNPKTHESVALKEDADVFMEKLSDGLDKQLFDGNYVEAEHNINPIDERYWYGKARGSHDHFIEKSINSKISKFENDIRAEIETKEKLNEFAQLGLKSFWLGIKDDATRYHDRYHHSVGVAKVASYLYDKAINNSGLVVNDREKQFLRLAALLHDVGHLPFSHLIEGVFNELNWRPAGYKGYYSHVFQTDEKIKELFNRDKFKDRLEKELGYNLTDIINLVNGRFGVAYLDAIINSPVDADKIDYVFRDTESTGRKISLAPIQFLKNIGDGAYITPEKFLAFSKTSAKAVTELLQTRKHLYQNLYLQPGIVILEGIVKLIIKTYFIYLWKLNDKDILNVLTLNEKGYPDLGEYKIAFCISDLKKLLHEAIDLNSDNIELSIVNMMVDEINRNERIFNGKFFENLKEGISKVQHTKGEDELKSLESLIDHRRFKGKETELIDIVRDIKLRMPGAAIIEISKFKNNLSTADSRKNKERSDGTNTYSEYILVPDGNYETWGPNNKAIKAIHDSSLSNVDENISVYLYPLSGKTDDPYFKQTLNLFDKLLNKKGIDSK